MIQKIEPMPVAFPVLSKFSSNICTAPTRHDLQPSHCKLSKIGLAIVD